MPCSYLNIGIYGVNFPQHEIAREVDAVEPEWNTSEHSVKYLYVVVFAA